MKTQRNTRSKMGSSDKHSPPLTEEVDKFKLKVSSPSCRRVLDFGSIPTKVTNICTVGGSQYVEPDSHSSSSLSSSSGGVFCIDLDEVKTMDTKLEVENTRPKRGCSIKRTPPLTKKVAKFKPKVSSTYGGRVLGFIQTKVMDIRTVGGYEFTRRVREYVKLDSHSSPSSSSEKGSLWFTSQAEAIVVSKKDEEEWLKGEQELFKQRASFFISSIRSVQGDRPFMGWKGSVVDSVVGVFLTQNTSDSLSSSAFMYLASKYPNQIITGDHTEHAIDWNAVRSAKHSEICNAIQERGMKNRIAKRIQEFLHKIHEKAGLIDLEWLRSATAEEARHYFMEVYGLGLKSTECLRLLTLRQRAFPVDRHVCRIVVRLGWVPLEKLPAGDLLHQLEEYPATDHVQEYLSQRLSILDVDTLHELHYQMISFGKVFCTKKKPNCNSCPLKNECKHFASASTSGGENTFAPTTPTKSPSPELVDIEDLRLSPMLRKVAGRSRTKHLVYELNDTHALVLKLEKRDQNDIKPYLLAIWPPVEEASDEETVFGTFLVPCRTATRGSFPLDGTFFQINEVFADDDTSNNPIIVPRKLLLNLPTNTLYCGSSISNISEGISYDETKECFLKGYVCIRGFNMKTREPRSLHCRFHQPLTRTKTPKPSRIPRIRTKNNGTSMK